MPYGDLVREIRECAAEVNLINNVRYSDDTDMYYVEKAGYSPIIKQVERASELMRRAKNLGEKLLEIGEPAAEAVAKGLRTTGWWRENLLHYAEQHRDLPVVRDTLKLLAKRQRDRLAANAREILERSKSATSRSIR